MNAAHCSIYVLFWSRIQARIPRCIVCRVSLVSFTLCLSWSWHFWSVLASYSVECFSLGLSDSFSWLDWGYAFLANYNGRDVGPFRCIIPRSTWCQCLITGGVNFDHLAVFARCPHCKVTILPLAINKYLTGRYFDTMQTSCFSPHLPTNLSIYWLLPATIITMVFTKWWLFYLHHSFYTY